jgi:pseudouridine synthase
MPSSRKPRSSAAREVHPSLAQYRQKERGERLQKVLADAGVAARRECEKLIIEGAVTVNGKTIDTLPAWADPKVDRIEVFGKPLRPAEEHVYVMLYKPRGTVCTNSDPEGRPRAIDLVNHPARARLYCVGRLDLDASGLLILTNDGEFANRLTHPRYGVVKGYDVTLDGRLDPEAIAEIERRIFAAGGGGRRGGDGQDERRSSLRLVSTDSEKSLAHLELCEHRNLQIKDLMLSLGHPVKKMRRTSFGPLKLKGLAVGEWRELAGREIEMLRRASRGLPTGGETTGPTARPAARERPRADLRRVTTAPAAKPASMKASSSKSPSSRSAAPGFPTSRPPSASSPSSRPSSSRSSSSKFPSSKFPSSKFPSPKPPTAKTPSPRPDAEARTFVHPAVKAKAAAAAAAMAAKPARGGDAGPRGFKPGGTPGAKAGGSAGGKHGGKFGARPGAPTGPRSNMQSGRAQGAGAGSSSPGFAKPGFPKPGSPKSGSSKPGSFKPGAAKSGFSKSGAPKPGFSGSGPGKSAGPRGGARSGGPRRERRA